MSIIDQLLYFVEEKSRLRAKIFKLFYNILYNLY